MYRGAILLAFLSFGLVAAATFGLFYSTRESGFSSPMVQTAIARKTANFLQRDQGFVKAFSNSLPAGGKISFKLPTKPTFQPRALAPSEQAVPIQALNAPIQDVPDDQEVRLKSLRQSIQILETSSSPEFAALSAQMARKTLSRPDLDPESSEAARKILDLSQSILQDFPQNMPVNANEVQLESVTN